MRLIAVLLLGLITAFWAVNALVLLFLPEGALGATFSVLIGAVNLVFAALYALSTWGVVKRSRSLHIFAIVMAVLGVTQPAAGPGVWLNWVLAVISLAAVVLLSQTIPHRVTKS
jgi:hypothetical protein